MAQFIISTGGAVDLIANGPWTMRADLGICP
jgi:hypothetical protein